MRTAKLKSAYNSLIIGPRGFGALSLRWIQFASVLRCARSSYVNNLDRSSEERGAFNRNTVQHRVKIFHQFPERRLNLPLSYLGIVAFLYSNV